MRPIWIASFLAGSIESEPAPSSNATLPPIVPGAFAAWAASADRGDEQARVAGDACLMPDGRDGRLFAVDADGTPSLVCLPA